MEPKELTQPSRKMQKWLLFYRPLALTGILTAPTGIDRNPKDGFLTLVVYRLMIAGISFVMAMIVCLCLYHLADLLSAAFRRK